ncbi:hypothetical protein CJ030_MR6G010293 [Morella rubra]|uniref:Uncharacterized protein n=1 Tax=Morella rubra TaxID=262757 RepID=A0A6A1VCN5_9ROSI|nr:hypothetical protein CJ030_MR6G010293 [Morella rubra]
MGKLSSARDGRKMFGAIALKQRKLRTYDLVGLNDPRPPKLPLPAPTVPKGPIP